MPLKLKNRRKHSFGSWDTPSSHQPPTASGGTIECETYNIHHQNSVPVYRRDTGRTVLKAVKDRIFIGPVEAMARQLGFLPYLEWAYVSAALLLSSSTIEHRVGDASAEFYMETRHEYRRTREVPGPSRPTLKRLIRNLRPDDTFYEIGANTGVITCLSGDIIDSDSGTLVAFEPHPRNAERLRQNLELNGLDATVLECLLSDSEGEAAFEVRGDTAGTGSHALSSAAADRIMTEEVTTVNALVDRGTVPAPDVVFIDAEGAELEIIRGMERILERGECRLIHCSVHADPDAEDATLLNRGGSPAKIHERLESHGFALETVPHSEDNYYLIAEQTA